MNNFDLKLFIISPEKPEEYNEHTLEAKIYIDGVEVSNESVSLYDLIESLKQSGEYYIYNCSCGVPGCAKILNGVKVKHKSNTIRWKTRIPVSYFGFKNWRTYVKTVKNKNFYFEKNKMLEIIKKECYRLLDEIPEDMVFDEFNDNSYYIRDRFEDLQEI